MRVSGSPTNSPTTARRKGSRKRRSLRKRRLSEDGHSPTTPGNRCAKNRSASRRKDCSLSTPRNCWKRASETSESERRLIEA